LFEVRGFHRDRRGGVTAEAAGDRLRFVYESLDGQPRSTEISFTPAPSTLSRKAAVFELDLDPGEARNLVWVSRCTTQWTTPQHAKLPAALRGALRSERRSPSGHRWTRVDSSDAGVNAVLGRSRADLAMLCSQTPHGSYPYAGIPWFSTPFGRDGVITGLETLWLDPELSRGILQFLAAFQATVVDPDRDAEPGKILHEMRRGELAELGEIPFGRYYGSVDSTPLFIALAGKYLQRTGDLETLRSLWPAIEAGLDWLERYGDRDGDGFVDYGGGGGRGLANQGWKDSHDSVFHADGSFAVPPIALCEVQGYAYLARNEAAVVAHALGKDALAVALRQRAAALAEAFEETFWCDPIGMFGLALDGRRRLCQVRSSNAGQVLFSGIARREHAERVARELTATRFFTGWGIRTVAEGERRYNPCSYHNGSVWPHDNALIALGLARYGLSSAVREVTDAVLGAAHRMQLRRLPELFCGFRRRPDRGPTLYPVACAPQAWAAAAPFALLEACLNPRFDPAGGQLYFHKPQLPAGLQWLRIRGLRVGPATADVRLLRDGDGVRAEVANGELRVHVVD